MKSKHAGRVLAGCVIFLFASVGYVKADPNEGALDIQSFLNSQASADTVRAVRYSNSYLRYSSSPIISGEHNVTSFFAEQDNWYDQRPADSNEDFHIRYLLEDPTTETKTSKVRFSFPYYPDYTFGNNPMVYGSDNLRYGPVFDLRRAFALAPEPNRVEIPLEDVPLGTSGEYGTGILDIGTRILGDTSDSGHVDLGDFALIAMDWGEGLGQYVGDIAGPNGIPDGYVDNHDLSAFCDDYLKDANDPNTW